MRIILPLLFSVSSLAAGLHAQTPATPSPLPQRIAVLDFDQAVLLSDPGGKARAQLDLRFKYWQKENDDEAAKQKPLKDKLSQVGLSETEKAKIADQIKAIDIKVARLKEDAAKDIEARKAEYFSPVAERVKDVLKVYGDEQNLAVVMNDVEDVDGPVIVKTIVVDVTSEIIRRVNADVEKRPLKPAVAAAASPAAQPPK